MKQSSQWQNAASILHNSPSNKRSTASSTRVHGDFIARAIFFCAFSLPFRPHAGTLGRSTPPSWLGNDNYPIYWHGRNASSTTVQN
jgi:hypothetical protein